MGLLTLLQRDPLGFFVLAALLLYSVIAHEVSHGWVAGLFGDGLAREKGRLTLNPASHIDPFGALMLFLVGFGWAKPVPVNYGFLRRIRFALPLVALAGPVTNVLIAAAAILLLQVPLVHNVPLLASIVPVVVRINIMLAAFNLIPIPPLDGSKVLAEFLPFDARAAFFRFERYGVFLLIALLYTRILDPVIAFMESGIYTLIGTLLTPFPR